MQWLFENWFLVIAGVVVLICAGYAVYGFFNMPSESQIAKVKEWLKYAVALSEQELGGGTGQLKLRFVYNLFMDKFPSVTKIISFELFSKWVDEALLWLEKQLETNNEIKAFVEGE